MNEKQLAALIVSELTAGLQRADVDLPVIAGNQPTTQGREDAGVYFFPIDDPVGGWQGRSYGSTTDGTLPMRDSQTVETSFQVQALLPDDPTDITGPTALDVLHTARMVIASLPFVQAMVSAGAGVQRPTDVRTPYFTNDRDQFEMVPSFDFTVSHERAIIQTIGAVESAAFDLRRV